MKHTIDMRYIDHLKSNKVSDNTIKAYSLAINQMLESTNKPVNDINRLDLEGWRKSISNLSSSSIHQKVAAVKGYFKFMKKIGVVGTNCAEEMESPAVVNQEKEYMSEKMLDDMIAVANIKEKAMLTFFKVNGVRVSELSNLTLEEYLNMKKCGHDFIKIRAKGNVKRFVYFSKELFNLIDAYLTVRVDNSKYLFTTERGNQLDPNNLNKKWKLLAKKAGIPFWGKISSHYFRMACATIYSEKGMAVEEIRDLLKHSSIAVTDTYLKSNPENIKNKILSY